MESAYFEVTETSTPGLMGARIDLPDGVGELVVGRSSASDVIVAATTVSRRHAKVSIGPSGWTLEDLESANGTFVNGTRIREPVVLADGDEVAFGTIVTRFADPGSVGSTVLVPPDEEDSESETIMVPPDEALPDPDGLDSSSAPISDEGVNLETKTAADGVEPQAIPARGGGETEHIDPPADREPARTFSVPDARIVSDPADSPSESTISPEPDIGETIAFPAEGSAAKPPAPVSRDAVPDDLPVDDPASNETVALPPDGPTGSPTIDPSESVEPDLSPDGDSATGQGTSPSATIAMPGARAPTLDDAGTGHEPPAAQAQTVSERAVPSHGAISSTIPEAKPRTAAETNELLVIAAIAIASFLGVVVVGWLLGFGP